MSTLRTFRKYLDITKSMLLLNFLDPRNFLDELKIAQADDLSKAATTNRVYGFSDVPRPSKSQIPLR